MPILNRPPADYEPPSDFKSFPDASYSVKGIQWFTLDNEEAPIFVARRDGVLNARYRTILENGEDGPPGSVSPAEVPLLVRAFGQDAMSLPNRKIDATAYLIAARDLINNAGKVVTVRSKGGWINHIPGMSLPKDTYFTVVFEGIKTKDGAERPSWRDGNWGKWFGVDLKVVGDIQQRPCPYDGLAQFCNVSYGLHANEQGEPEFDTDNGVWTSGASRTNHFIQSFAPTLYEMQFADSANLCPELNKVAFDMNRRCIVHTVYSKKNGTVYMDMGSLQALDDERIIDAPMPSDSTPDGVPASKAKEELPARDVEDETPVFDRVVDAMNRLVTGGDAFDGKNKMTTAGKTWAKKHLKPFLKENNIPARVESWSDSQLHSIEAFLIEMEEGDDGDF